ncbi:MAG TPA: hypothetical protein VK917_09180 [Ilumatobacter sp.]|nr:hypothetical protein [Ilumatobacter sp.]
MLAGTIVASNYLAMAEVLARSYLRSHPGQRFVILVIDDGEAEVEDDRIEVWRLADLDIASRELAAMLTMYEVREFSTAVKPPFLEALLGRDEVACYIDPDIYVYAPIDEVVRPARDHDIVLTPHVLRPVPRDGLDVSEQSLQLAGMFNLGFLGVGRGAVPFLRWWAERLRTDAVIDFSRGLFTDQRWVDWVPVLFDHVVCRDPGMNIAWWNAHERDVQLVDRGGDEVPTIDGGPVRFVHFSGYDPSRPEVFSHWQPRPRQSWRPDDPLRILAERYGEELVASGHFERRRAAYQYDVADDGTPLTPGLRRLWRQSLLDELAGGRSLADTRTPPAFGPESERLGAWLDGVAGGTVDHPHARRERVVWERRLDLQRAFPDVDGFHAHAFRDWLDREPDARSELGDFRPAWYVPSPAPTAGDRSLARRMGDRARHGLRRGLDLGTRQRRSRRPLDPATRPIAFLHVPKCAGTSLATAVRQALPGHRWAPWIFDPDQFGPLADRELSDELRERTLPDPAAFAEYDAAIGHFSLPSLLARFDPADVVTILREPRCRLLSHHQYWRNLDDDATAEHDTWSDGNATADELEFGDWLADPRVAYQTDNLFARMIVPDHAGIRPDSFIQPASVPSVMASALAEIDRLGWVDVIERGDSVWRDLGERLGVPVVPERHNVTVDRHGRPNPVEQLLGPEAVEHLRARTVIDRAIWRSVAERRGVVDPDGAADVVWSQRLLAALQR